MEKSELKKIRNWINEGISWWGNKRTLVGAESWVEARGLEDYTFEEIKELSHNIGNLDRYEGNLNDYNNLKKSEYEIMDAGYPRKYVYTNGPNLEYNLLFKLIENGCAGVIGHVPAHSRNGCSGGYGTPVRPKQNK